MKKTNSNLTPLWEDEPLGGEAEIFSHVAEKRGSSLFLGRYSLNEVAAVLAKRNFLKEAKHRNLWPLAYDLDSTEYPLQRLLIYHREKKPESVIVDLKIKETDFWAQDKLPVAGSLPKSKCLSLEWLTLQNPILEFSEKKPPLPGQTHPGLGIGKKVLDIFIYLAKLMRKDCLLAYPAYFHNALLFGRYFRFLKPEKEGEVLAVRKLFHDVPFKRLAWIVHLNCLKNRDGGVYEWKAEEQLFAISKPLREYFDSRPYRETAKSALKNFPFSIDWECFEKKLEDMRRLCGSGANLI